MDLLKAVLYAGLPIALISYFLVILARKESNTDKKNAKQLKQQVQQLEPKKRSFLKALLYKKWMKFGGGFYGVVAFLTYLHLEIYEVLEFFQALFGDSSLFSKALMLVFVEFFVDSIFNFMYAFLWPFYWLNHLPIGSFWLWLSIAILAHVLATKIAMLKKIKPQAEEIKKFKAGN